jgi:hypothetical protein
MDGLFNALGVDMLVLTGLRDWLLVMNLNCKVNGVLKECLSRSTYK